MGLDMYLERRLTLANYASLAEANEHYANERKLAQAVLQALGADPAEYEGGSVVVGLPQAYWRKVNWVHRWFVDNVQDGVDDCQAYYVEREKLEELKQICVQLLDAHENQGEVDAEELALELLPPQEGFFFGDTEIGEWYWESLRDTIEMLDRALAHDDGDLIASFYYQASW